MNHMTMRGVGGEVRWGYHKAATLGAWVMTMEGSQVTVTAPVLDSDAFTVSQQPLTFVVPRPTGAWRWPVVQVLQNADGTFQASLGPQE